MTGTVLGTILGYKARPLSHMPPEVAALMAALQHNLADTRQLQQLGDEEWNKLLTFTDRANLTLTLAQFDCKGFPLWVMGRLQSNLTYNALRFERVKATYIEAAAALLKMDVEHIVLKGFTQFPNFVCNPRGRAQSDLDFYVPPAMMGRAQKALESIGYRMDETLDHSRADHLPPFVRPGDWQWRGNHFDPDMPLSIELHFALWNERVARFSIPGVELFWERRLNRTIEDMAFSSLNSIDHLGYFTLHIIRDIFAGGSAINRLYELSAFLHHHADDDAFWKRWQQTHSPHLRSIEMVAIYQARAWFGCNLHSSLERQLETLPAPIAKWLERFAGSPLNGIFLQNKDFVWLHMAFLDSFKEKRQFILRSLIPSHVPGRNNPVTRLKNQQLRFLRVIHPRFRYLSYILARLRAHARIVPETVASGIAWWLSQRQVRE
jgi:hypothetical protein